MLKIGLTGGIGSGKTTVSNLFARLGIPVIDTDIIAREVVNQEDVLQSLQTLFDNHILTDEGALDRKALASIVFSDSNKKAQLDALLHPLIRKRVLEQTESIEPGLSPYIIIVVPLLFESGFYTFVDATITVNCDEEARISRVVSRDHREESEIRSIIAHQLDDTARCQKADYCINNNSDINHLEKQVLKLHHQLQQIKSLR